MALTPRPRGEGRDSVVVIIEGRRREGRRDVVIAVANRAAAPSPPRQGEEREADVPSSVAAAPLNRSRDERRGPVAALSAAPSPEVPGRRRRSDRRPSRRRPGRGGGHRSSVGLRTRRRYQGAGPTAVTAPSLAPDGPRGRPTGRRRTQMPVSRRRDWLLASALGRGGPNGRAGLREEAKRHHRPLDGPRRRCRGAESSAERRIVHGDGGGVLGLGFGGRGHPYQRCLLRWTPVYQAWYTGGLSRGPEGP